MMTDRPIEQLYCTHCTYGTSALHRHAGNVKDQPFEYSARAGSIKQADSHQKFQQFEKQIFRGLPLPSDAPADVRRQLAGSTSPWRRLVVAESQATSVVAHVTYRTTDTSTPPRIGSYFAHLLFQESGEAARRRWSLAEALQMWGAEFWVVDDRNDLPFDLQEVSDLSQLPGFGNVINDATLISFLTTPSDGNFHDGPASSRRHELSPACAIPLRWRRDYSAKDRLAFFTHVFQSVLKLNLERRERLTLAIEPSVAALLFYGVIRLLPLSGLVDQLSVSTFEPHQEASSFVLTATDFYDPTTCELPLSASRGGIAINSYSNKPLSPETVSPYVAKMVELFLDPRRGPSAVNQNRLDFDQITVSGLVTIRDIEQFLGVPDLVERFIQTTPSNPVSERELAGLTNRAARLRFYELVFTRINAFSEGHSFWRGIGESPPRTASILRMIREEPAHRETSQILERICKCIPARELPRFLEEQQIPPELRVERLKREVVANGQLPPGCDFLWSQKPSNSNEPPLLERLLSQLDDPALESFCRSTLKEAVAKRDVTGGRMQRIISCLAKGARQPDSKKKPLLVEILSDRAFGNDEWDTLLRNKEYRSQLFDVFPVEDPFLKKRLIDILDQLHCSSSRFPMRMDILKAGQSRLPSEHRQEFETWLKIQTHLQDLQNEVDATPKSAMDQIWSGPRNRKLEEIGKGLGRESKALLDKKFDCFTEDERLNILRPLAGSYLESGQLPKAFIAGLSLTLRDPKKPKIRKSPTSNRSLISTTMLFLPYAATAIMVLAGAVLGIRNPGIFQRSSKNIDESGEKKIQKATDNKNVEPKTLYGKPQGDEPKHANDKNKTQDSDPELNPEKKREFDTTAKTTPNNPLNAAATPPDDRKDSSSSDAHVPAEEKLKGPSWMPDKVYFAEPHGHPLFGVDHSWKVRTHVQFLTLHGPQLFQSTKGTPIYDDTKTWPLFVSWEDDITIVVSTRFRSTGENGPLDKITIRRIIFQPSSSVVEVVSQTPGKGELEMLNAQLRDKLEASWKNCVIGFHFHDRSKTFYSLDTQKIIPASEVLSEEAELKFAVVKNAANEPTDRRPWAISGDSVFKFNEKILSIGKGDGTQLFTGREIIIRDWPMNMILPSATAIIEPGFVTLSIKHVREVKTTKNQIKVNEIIPPKQISTIELLSDALEGPSKLLNTDQALADDLKIVENDENYKKSRDNQRDILKKCRLLCRFLDIPPPGKLDDEPKLVDHTEEQYKQNHSKWLSKLNDVITNTKVNINKKNPSDRRREINDLKILFTEIKIKKSKFKFCGVVYRVIDGEASESTVDADANTENPNEIGNITRGIAVMVAEFKRK
jgi:hypothetical protein